PPLVDVSRGAVDDDAADAAQPGAERQIAAPACGVDARALLYDDHVASSRRFDRRRAQMPRCGRPPIVFLELDGDDGSRDPATGRQPMEARDDSGEAELVERVGDGAGVQASQAIDEIIHVGSPRTYSQ